MDWVNQIEATKNRMAETGENYPYEDIEDLIKAVRVMESALEKLAEVEILWVESMAMVGLNSAYKIRKLQR